MSVYSPDQTPSYEKPIIDDQDQLEGMLQEELVLAQDNLDAIRYLVGTSRHNVIVAILVQVLFLVALGFLIYSLSSQSSKFIAPVFEPFVIPLCIMLCFLLYNSYREYQNKSTELYQLRFCALRLERAVKFANSALDRPSAKRTQEIKSEPMVQSLSM
jgi:hypothetical protein